MLYSLAELITLPQVQAFVVDVAPTVFRSCITHSARGSAEIVGTDGCVVAGSMR